MVVCTLRILAKILTFKMHKSHTNSRQQLINVSVAASVSVAVYVTVFMFIFVVVLSVPCYFCWRQIEVADATGTWPGHWLRGQRASWQLLPEAPADVLAKPNGIVAWQEICPSMKLKC